MINVINSKDSKMTCTDCGHNEFTQYNVPHLDLGTSEYGMDTRQNVGDLTLSVCTKCNICKIQKPKYWS